MVLELLRKASLKRGFVFRKCDYENVTRNGVHRSSHSFVRPKNPAALMGHVYGPWRMPGIRTRHAYTQLEAAEWEKIVRELTIVDSGTGKPFKVPVVGALNVEFFSVPRCATPIELLNATGMKRLIHMLVTHTESLSDLLRLCSSLVCTHTFYVHAHGHTLSIVP